MTSANVLHDIHDLCCTAPAQSDPTTSMAIIVNNLTEVIRNIVSMRDFVYHLFILNHFQLTSYPTFPAGS